MVKVCIAKLDKVFFFSFSKQTQQLLSAQGRVSAVPSTQLSLLMFYSKSGNGFAVQTDFPQATWHLGLRTQVTVGDWKATETQEGAFAQNGTTLRPHATFAGGNLMTSSGLCYQL